MKVLWLTNVPSPYRVDFFNELGKRCELTVVFEKKTSDERDPSWSDYSFKHFNGIILKGITINTDTAICPGILNDINWNYYDEIVITNIYSPTGILATAMIRRLKLSYWIEGDGAFVKQSFGIKDIVKKIIISRAKGCFSTGKPHDEYYIKYGAKEQNIIRYPFTSLHEIDICRKISTDDEKSMLRNELGIAEKHIVLTVGRFSYMRGYGKGYDVLLKVAQELDKDYGWYIVGGEATDEFKKMKEDANLYNVHFVGFLDKSQLKKYYRSADIFVLMTVNDAWGLVINEAMAQGLPIISTDRCGAALELVEENENGFVLSPGDYISLREKIETIIMKSLYNKLGQKSIDIISHYTLEEMARRHIDVMNNKLVPHSYAGKTE